MSVSETGLAIKKYADALSALGKELQCPICMSLMINSNMLNCGHAFCR